MSQKGASKAGGGSKPRKGRTSNWGGARAGAGRPRSSTSVGHTPRERVSRDVPQHIMLRLVPGLPSLRSKQVLEVVDASLADARAVGVGIVECAVQPNHIELVLEATSARDLGRSMQKFTVRLAKRLNRLLTRSGTVFADRFESHALKTPAEVRRAVAYVSSGGSELGQSGAAQKWRASGALRRHPK